MAERTIERRKPKRRSAAEWVLLVAIVFAATIIEQLLRLCLWVFLVRR